MKRTSSSQRLATPTTALQNAAGAEPAPPPPPRSDDQIRADRVDALRRHDAPRLRALLAERPDLPLRLELDPDADAQTVHTLIDALPPQGAVPPITVDGPLPDGVDQARLNRLFTHPGLLDLSLIEPQLSNEQQEDIGSALALHGSNLQSLSWDDDPECLMDPPFLRILEQLTALRSLAIGHSASDHAPAAERNDDLDALASFLLHRPLDRLELDHCGQLMPALCGSWPANHALPWQSLTLRNMDIGHSEAVYLPWLDRFMCRSVGDPQLKALRLENFHEFADAYDPVLHGDQVIPQASHDLVGHLAMALANRQAPLHLAVDSDDEDALFIVMAGLTGDPDRIADDGAGERPVPASGIACVRSLDMTFRADLTQMDPTLEDPRASFLNALADWLPQYPRLDSLRIAIEPQGDSAAVPATPASPETCTGPLVQALDAQHLTSLELAGRLLTPVPAPLQPCQQRVSARATHAALQTRALDVCFDFLCPPMKLPTDIGRTLVDDIGSGGQAQHPVTILPQLDRQHLINFVDRYNQLAAPQNRHPLTGLSQEIRQRMTETSDADS